MQGTKQKLKKRTFLCHNCNKRYVPVGRTLAQTCPHCGESTVKKKATDAQIRRLADDLFSLWVRWDNADSRGWSRCFTCGKRMRYYDSQAGHFVKRRHDVLRYDEMNVKCQCPLCNGPVGSGKPWEFGQRLDLIYGEGTAQTLKDLEKSSFRFNRTGLISVAKDNLLRLEHAGIDIEGILKRYPAAAWEVSTNTAGRGVPVMRPR